MPKTKDPEKLERWAQFIYGCTRSEALALNDGLELRQRGSTAMAYVHQRHAANDRGIEWAITFPQWVEVWRDSKRWAQRGVGRGKYVMARHGDAGPYASKNVSIQLATENSRDGIKKAHATMASHGWAQQSRIGKGRGWTYRKDGRLRYQVTAGRRYVGTFATQAEAEAAYAGAVRAIHEVRSVQADCPFFVSR